MSRSFWNLSLCCCHWIHIIISDNLCVPHISKMSESQKACCSVAAGAWHGFLHITLPMLPDYFYGRGRGRNGKRGWSVSWRWNIHSREDEGRISEVSMVTVLSIISFLIHSLIQIQIYCFLIHMLTCKVKTACESLLHCLMSFSKSLSSALPLVLFINTEREKGRNIYHLVSFLFK